MVEVETPTTIEVESPTMVEVDSLVFEFESPMVIEVESLATSEVKRSMTFDVEETRSVFVLIPLLRSLEKGIVVVPTLLVVVAFGSVMAPTVVASIALVITSSILISKPMEKLFDIMSIVLAMKLAKVKGEQEMTLYDERVS